MIDGLVAVASHRKHKMQDSSYSVGQAISAAELTNESANRLTVIFPPWHGVERLASIYTRRAVQFGTALLRYTFHDQILSADIDSVRGSFDHIQNVASDEINSLMEKHRYKGLHLIGYSLGSVALAKTAGNINSNFQTTCVVGSSNLARSTWEGIRTQHIREELELAGVTEDILDEEWVGLAPGNLTANFRDNPVHLLISQSDRTLPYKYQKELATHLADSNVDLTISRTRYGHVSSVVGHSLMGEL